MSQQAIFYINSVSFFYDTYSFLERFLEMFILFSILINIFKTSIQSYNN